MEANLKLWNYIFTYLPAVSCTIHFHNIVKMVALLFHMIFFFFYLQYHHQPGTLVAGHEDTPTRCSTDGPTISFPFWLSTDVHQPNCGGASQAFSLSCSPSNLTLLTNHPFSSQEVFVSEIDYKSRSIRIDHNPLSAPSLHSLNLSDISPFRLRTEDDHNPFGEDMFLFSCPKHSHDSYYRKEISCLSNLTHKVYAYKSYLIDDTDILNCRRMFHDNLDRSVVDALMNCTMWWNWRQPSPCRNDKPSYYLITGLSLLVVVVLVSLYCAYRRIEARKADQAMVRRFLKDYKALKPTRYTYEEIKKITNNFIDKLGQGGYGTVYKGKLSNDVLVAAKILKNFNGNGQDEFLNEVGTIGTIHHVNVVRLVGYCADGFRRALVYEFLPNDSLEKFISSPDQRKRSLSWDKLQEIALGIAKGIEYLHQGCDQQILHFDIKPHNILLDENFNPKVADFGLAKLCSKDQSAVSMTIARGTIGYIAPEVISRNFGKVSHKSDVYSFGMLLLEMAGGRKNPEVKEDNDSEIYFPEWIYNHLNRDTEEVAIEIEDDQGGEKIVKKLMTVGLWCIQWTPGDRPSMKTVVQMLEGDEDTLPMPPNPFVTRNSVTGGTLNSLEVISECESETLD